MTSISKQHQSICLQLVLDEKNYYLHQICSHNITISHDLRKPSWNNAGSVIQHDVWEWSEYQRLLFLLNVACAGSLQCFFLLKYVRHKTKSYAENSLWKKSWDLWAPSTAIMPACLVSTSTEEPSMLPTIILQLCNPSMRGGIRIAIVKIWACGHLSIYLFFHFSSMRCQKISVTFYKIACIDR